MLYVVSELGAEYARGFSSQWLPLSFLFERGQREPPHIHVTGKGGEMKVWLKPISVDPVYRLSPREQRMILQMVKANVALLMEKWNEFAAKKASHYPAIMSAKIGADTVTASLSDGREISIPIAWFERLRNATKTQLKKFEISPAGYGIHWPEIDEDISVKAFVDGID